MLWFKSLLKALHPMKIHEVVKKRIAIPQIQEPLVLSAQQQAQAVEKARQRKLKTLIARQQASQRNAAAANVSKQDIETAFILSSQGKVG